MGKADNRRLGTTPAGGTVIMRIEYLMVLLLAITGCKNTSNEGVAPTSGEAPIIIADGNGFTPNQIALTKGGSGKLRFERKSDETCATEVVFPDLNIKKPLPLNQVVEVNVPTTDAKTYAFTCGMGMYKSAVVVN